MTATSFSQSFDKVEKAIVYSYQNDNWVTEQTTYPERMFIIIEGSEIRITNKTESKFVTYGYPKKENTKDYESNTWDAYDKDGVSCRFSITNYYNYEGYSVFIMYNRAAIQYIVSKK
jgi:hypothetical protein